MGMIMEDQTKAIVSYPQQQHSKLLSKGVMCKQLLT